jgi:hypothetical protein
MARAIYHKDHPARHYDRTCPGCASQDDEWDFDATLGTIVLLGTLAAGFALGYFWERLFS